MHESICFVCVCVLFNRFHTIFCAEQTDMNNNELYAFHVMTVLLSAKKALQQHRHFGLFYVGAYLKLISSFASCTLYACY